MYTFTRVWRLFQKLPTLLAFVSIYVCNAQCKLEIPIVLRYLTRRHLHPWLTSLNWKYRKIDKWYTNKIVVNCCQKNCQTNEISTKSTFHPFLMIRTIRIVLKTWKKCNASTLLYAPTCDLPPITGSEFHYLNGVIHEAIIRFNAHLAQSKCNNVINTWIS